MKRALFFLLLLLAVPLLGQARVEVSTQVNLPENPLPFGKAAELVVTLSWPESENFTPPEPTSLNIPNAHILDQYSVDLGKEGVLRRVAYHIHFTRFEPGEFEVPAIALGQDLKTVPRSLEFSAVPKLESDQEGEIRPNKPVVELSTANFWRTFASWVCGVLAILALLVAIFNHFGILDRFRSPKARALRQIKRLSKKNLNPDDLLIALVEVLRTYLHQAYGHVTREATSSEISKQITLDNRCQQLKSISQELLQSGDRVKFAGTSYAHSEVRDLKQKLDTTIRQEKKVARS